MHPRLNAPALALLVLVLVLASCTNHVTTFVREVSVTEHGELRVVTCRLDEDGWTAKSEVDRATCATTTTALPPAQKGAP